MDSLITDKTHGGLTLSLGKLRQIDVKKFGQVGHPPAKKQKFQQLTNFSLRYRSEFPWNL